MQVGESKSLSSLLFKQGQLLRFRLTANPTKVLTEQNEEKRKIRVPLIKPAQQEDWLKRKLDGFAVIETVMPRNEAPLYFNQKCRGGKIVPVNFEGILRVVNPEKFKEQIYEEYNEKGEYIAGIGHAKAFGCGLMLVRKI
jgi:CRISPR-associated protein Cas6/Cse3/CasE subtype I-E